MIERRSQVLPVVQGCVGEIAHSGLQDDDRKPAGTDEEIENDARPDPGLVQRKAAEMDQGEPGHRLQDRRGCGEHIVGDDDMAKRGGESFDVADAIGHEKKECDAETGAEQDGGARDMQELHCEIEVQIRSTAVRDASRWLDQDAGPTANTDDRRWLKPCKVSCRCSLTNSLTES